MRQDMYITGTDTDVGKTYVAARLIQNWVANGERVAAMKPVASGSACNAAGELRNDDALRLMQASNIDAEYAQVNPYAFAAAIAPEYAAEQLGRAVDIEIVAANFAHLKAESDRVLVEGAGGWLSPINAQLDQNDLAQALGIRRIILVVGMRLGCVHNARATMQAIQHSGVHIAGWVANEALDSDPNFDDNVRAIARYTQAPLLAKIRHGDDAVYWLREP